MITPSFLFLILGTLSFKGGLIIVSILLLLFFIYLVFSIFSISHSLFLHSLCRVKVKEKLVFLSFDDGPSDEFTPGILDILKAGNIKATFFCTGFNALSHPELLKRMIKEGHQVGNHTFSHDWRLLLKGSKRLEADILHADKAFTSILDEEIQIFRPPYGVTNPALARAVKKFKLYSIGWDIRSLDTMKKDPEHLKKRIIKRLRPGSIILLHDNRNITGQILSDLVDGIVSNGYKIVPLNAFLSPF